MLYRLDHLTQAGTVPICDFIGPVLIREWKLARSKALAVAKTDPDGCVQITRIGNSGQLSTAADVYPDGRVVRLRK